MENALEGYLRMPVAEIELPRVAWRVCRPFTPEAY
jgi:hypothetical protein